MDLAPRHRAVLGLGTCQVAKVSLAPDPLLHERRSEEGEVRTKPANRKEGKPEPKQSKELRIEQLARQENG